MTACLHFQVEKYPRRCWGLTLTLDARYVICVDRRQWLRVWVETCKVLACLWTESFMRNGGRAPAHQVCQKRHFIFKMHNFITAQLYLCNAVSSCTNSWFKTITNYACYSAMHLSSYQVMWKKTNRFLFPIKTLVGISFCPNKKNGCLNNLFSYLILACVLLRTVAALKSIMFYVYHVHISCFNMWNSRSVFFPLLKVFQHCLGVSVLSAWTHFANPCTAFRPIPQKWVEWYKMKCC